MDALARCLELDRRVAIRGATETITIPEGCVVLNRDLPDVYFLNEVVLDAPLPTDFDAEALIALAERWLDGLGHRFVRVDDQQAGERVAPALTQAGWDRSPTVMMAVAGAPQAAVEDPRAREISGAEHEALLLATFAEIDYGVDASPGLDRRLVDAQLATLAVGGSLRFGAGVDGGLQATCQLYLDADVGGIPMAMVETVGTLAAYRGRGLAKAVVSRAMLAAADWGAELIMVPADADDWPQIIYSGLGFEPVGVQIVFTLRGTPT